MSLRQEILALLDLFRNEAEQFLPKIYEDIEDGCTRKPVSINSFTLMHLESTRLNIDMLIKACEKAQKRTFD